MHTLHAVLVHTLHMNNIPSVTWFIVHVVALLDFDTVQRIALSMVKVVVENSNMSTFPNDSMDIVNKCDDPVPAVVEFCDENQLCMSTPPDVRVKTV